MSPRRRRAHRAPGRAVRLGPRRRPASDPATPPAPAAAATPAPSGGLRSQALGGARYLVGREMVGIAVRTGGVLVVTAIVGPEQYGLFAGPFFVVQFLAVVATWGADVFLIRRAGEVARAWFDQVFTFLLLSGVVVAALGLVGAEVSRGFLPDPRVVLPLQVLLLTIPVNILWVPAKATLERRFDYRRLAVSELGADVAQYVVAVTLALLGAGLWAPVAGFATRQVFVLVASCVMARFVPRLRWDAGRVREVLAFGGGVSGAALAARARDLVVAVVVGRYLGASGVGVAALTMRLVESTAFLNRVMNRLSMVALGRLQNDAVRLRLAVEEMSAVQVLAVGPLLVALCAVGSGLLPVLLGERWADIGALLPLASAAALLIALLSVPNTALVVLGRRWTVFASQAGSLAIYVVASVLLVPRLGLVGLGLAQLASTVVPWLRNQDLKRSHGFRYRRALPWLVATLPLLFVVLLPWWGWVLAALPAVVVLCVPWSRRELRHHLTTLRSSGGRGPAARPARAPAPRPVA